LKAAAADPEHVVVHEGPRGAPENVGAHLSTVHPVVRTNPVTGWKSIYAVGPFPKYINELDPQESEELLGLFVSSGEMKTTSVSLARKPLMTGR
jgi:alpha-ketoglutarate-dependent taurine dioxygenase